MRLLYLAVFLTLPALAADPTKILAGLEFVVPTQVEWQGSLPSLPEERQEAMIDGLGAMLRDVAKQAPAENNIFHWTGNRERLNKKQLLIIFTDAKEIQVRPPIGDSPQSIPVLYPFPMMNLMVRSGPQRDMLFFILIVRVDRCLINPGTADFRPHAFVETAMGLAGQLLGYAKDTFLDINYFETVHPDMVRNAERVLAGRKRSFDAEARWLDLFIEKAKAKGFPAEQIQAAEQKRAYVYEQGSQVLLTDAKDPNCSERVRNN